MGIRIMSTGSGVQVIKEFGGVTIDAAIKGALKSKRFVLFNYIVSH